MSSSFESIIYFLFIFVKIEYCLIIFARLYIFLIFVLSPSEDASGHALVVSPNDFRFGIWLLLTEVSEIKKEPSVRGSRKFFRFCSLTYYFLNKLNRISPKQKSFKAFNKKVQNFWYCGLLRKFRSFFVIGRNPRTNNWYEIFSPIRCYKIFSELVWTG